MPKTRAEIRIQLLDNGQVRLNYPTENRVLAYGLLGVAREMVAGDAHERRFETKDAEGKRIARPGPGDERRFGGKGGG